MQCSGINQDNIPSEMGIKNRASEVFGGRWGTGGYGECQEWGSNTRLFPNWQILFKIPTSTRSTFWH